MANRKIAEEFIYKFIKDIDPSGYNTEKYKIIFTEMNDKEFDDYMVGLRDKTKFLVLFKPAFKTKEITLENNLKIAKKYNVKFFQKLVVTNNDTTPDYKTPIEYLVIDLPFKRQSQNLIKKINIPENNKTIDQLTGQPTGISQGAKISYPELQLLTSMGLDKSIEELIKYRGGDKGGFNAYNTMFIKYGVANLKTLENYSTSVESTNTLKVYLSSMHLRSSL